MSKLTGKLTKLQIETVQTSPIIVICSNSASNLTEFRLQIACLMSKCAIIHICYVYLIKIMLPLASHI